MKLVVGLGNPGVEYENTRHNVGFEVIDQLRYQFQILNNRYQKRFVAEVGEGEDVKLVKPLTFMNRSGWAVKRLVDFYKLELKDVWIIHDDLDINLGEFKIDFGKGPKVHNGVNSIEEQMGSKEFWRVRIGTEARTNEERSQWPGEKYVLFKLKPGERQVIEGVVKQTVEDLVRRW